MDYEKAYKDALERAKEQLDGAKVFDYDNEQIAHDIRTTVYGIFSELKESEDEKVKRGIIKFLKENKDFPEDWIAWLEKQGEQKAAWSEEDEKMMQCIHKYVKASASNFDYDNIQIWFRNLKNKVQLHWKPTNQQMNALKRTCENDYVQYNTILKSLYKDLKKL